MDHILFIVRREGINDDVDSHLESGTPLGFAPWHAFIDPLAKSVPCPSPGQVILGVYDRGPVIDEDAFQVWIDPLTASDARYDVEALIDRVVCGKPF